MVYLSWRLGKPPCTVHIFIPTILILALFRKKGRVFLRCRAKTGHARRVSATPFPGGSPFLGTLFMVQPSCGAIRRFRAGDFALCGARENGAPARGQKDRQPTVFYPLGTPTFPLFLSRRTERLCRSYLSSGPKKGTAVPLPVHRPQSAIPFTAALKPLELCDSIYAKPVQSAAITPRQCGKREPIPFLYASYLRSRAVRPVREAA